jgi:general nucleoside transport system ATP-binding protein
VELARPRHDLTQGPGRPADVIEMRSITKSFGPTTANRSVDFQVRHGEVHALLGENGAGKSTLMNVLSGALRPDSGEIFVRGEPIRLRSPEDAARAGIGMVHQHFQLIDAFTVSQNVHIGWREAPRIATHADLVQRTRRFAEEFGVPIDPETRVWQLSVAEQQWVEILRTLSRGAKTLILDEPTAVLAPQEADELLARLRRFAHSGRSAVLITHKLREVLDHSDWVTVMRGGEVVGTLPTSAADERTLVELMVGGQLRDKPRPPLQRRRECVLSVNELCASDDRRLPALHDISFDVTRGEVVGIAGVAGNGQRQLGEVLTGLRAPDSGSLRLAGVDMAGKKPRDFIRAGVGHIPEDRWNTGLVKGQPIWVNAVLKSYTSQGLRRGFLVSRRRAREFARALAASSNVRHTSVDSVVDHLSGGNAQRLLTGREIESATTLLVALHATRGLDVRATAQVRTALVTAAREKGLGVVFVSEDLDEVLEVCDRMLVLSGGSIRGEFDTGNCNREEVGMLMAGGRQSAGEVAA